MTVCTIQDFQTLDPNITVVWSVEKAEEYLRREYIGKIEPHYCQDGKVIDILIIPSKNHNNVWYAHCVTEDFLPEEEWPQYEDDETVDADFVIREVEIWT